MTTVLNRDSIKVKRDLQRRVENWVIEYCNALEENFKQYSINSYKRNIESPTSATVGHTSYYEEQLQKLKMVLQIYINSIMKLVKNISKYLIFNIKNHAIIITALLVIVLEV